MCNIKRTLATIFLIISLSLCGLLASCGEKSPAPEEPKEEACTNHTDKNGDQKCDACDFDMTPAECAEHKDEDGDNKCDACDFDMTPAECTEHKDEDGDGKCDACDFDMTPVTPECTEHKDEDGDGKCDACDFDMTPPAPSKTEITLVEGGKGKFSFVVASGYSGEISKTVATLANDLDKIGVEASVLTDAVYNISDCEVLIGAVTTRGDEYKIDEHTLGYDGYCIKLIEGKVLILGGSEKALIDAIGVFKKEILGVSRNTDSLDTVVMTEEDNIEVIIDDYTVKTVTIAGNDLRDYSITVDKRNTTESSVALKMQENIYKKIGVWLPIVDRASVEGNYIDILLTTAKTCASEKGFIAKVADGNLLFDCGFENKIEGAVVGLIMTEITNKKVPDVTIKEGFSYEKEDYKNIYYKDFGAKGDGKTDDFYAIKACHDEANAYGHVVHAERSATYYIGKGSGYDTISIQTDTYWHGCKFIFDNDQIKPPIQSEGEKGDAEYYVPIFSVTGASSEAGGKLSFTAANGNLLIDSLKEGATNIGFAPGYRALVQPLNNNIRHFIRYGSNKDEGAAQQEIIMVNADGSIDPSTPVQWNYDVITSLNVYRLDDETIIIDGYGDNGEMTHVNSTFIGCYNTYYSRNIKISRANTTIQGIKHTISDETINGAPCSGFIQIQETENIVVNGCEFQRPMDATMGSYEISAGNSNNILWKNCTQSNFFADDGSTKSGGLMGTNRCKNLQFDNMFVCSFDAHCGTYNATLKNSSCEHINFIGEGEIILENMTIYADVTRSGLVFRSDYGSTWQGTVKIDGLDLKYEKDYVNIELFKNVWYNHFFGYQTYMPETVWISNVRTVKITHGAGAGVDRPEEIVAINEKPLRYSSELEKYTNADISDPNADMVIGGHPNQDFCACTEFNDTDGDGLCNNKNCRFPQSSPELSKKNANPYIPTKEIYIENCPGLVMIFPTTPQFKDMKVYVEGELTSGWYTSDGKVTVPGEPITD